MSLQHDGLRCWPVGKIENRSDGVGMVASVQPRLWLWLRLGNLPDAGERLLRMCRVAQGRDFRIALELQRDIRAHLDVITDAVRHDQVLGRVFLEILGAVGRARG